MHFSSSPKYVPFIYFSCYQSYTNIIYFLDPFSSKRPFLNSNWLMRSVRPTSCCLAIQVKYGSLTRLSCIFYGSFCPLKLFHRSACEMLIKVSVSMQHMFHDQNISHDDQRNTEQKTLKIFSFFLLFLDLLCCRVSCFLKILSKSKFVWRSGEYLRLIILLLKPFLQHHRLNPSLVLMWRLMSYWSSANSSSDITELSYCKGSNRIIWSRI